MLYHEQSGDYRPLFWMNGHPFYANTLLVIAHVTSFVVCAICISYYHFGPVFDALGVNTAQVWHGQVWRLFSYIAFDPYFFGQGHSLWFLWSMLLLWFIGREVEQFTGRRTYLLLYASLVLIPAVLLCLLGLAYPTDHLNCFEAIFGVFVAFATIYPGAIPMILWLPFRCSVLAWIFLAVFSLIDLAYDDFAAIFMLWTSSAVGFIAMKMIGVSNGTGWFTDWIEERRVQRLAAKHQIKVLKDTQATESIDQILDKISKQGVASLTSKERAALERARTKLLKRDEH